MSLRESFSQRSLEYLTNKGVFKIYEDLTSELIIHQPEDHIQFMIDHLKAPARKIIFLLNNYITMETDVAEIAVKISDEFGLKRIFASEIVRDELMQSDEEMANNVNEMLKSSKKGAVLVNYPQSVSQARQLHNVKILPTHVLIVVEQDIDINVSGLDLMYKSRLRCIPLNVQLGDLKNAIKQPFSIGGPQRGKRIFVLGKRITEITNKLAQKLDLVYLNPKVLMHTEITQETELGLSCRDSPELIEDKENIFKVIHKWLAKDHIVSKGFVLEGWPTTLRELALLKKVGFAPDKLVRIANTAPCLETTYEGPKGEKYFAEDDEHLFQKIYNFCLL